MRTIYKYPLNDANANDVDGRTHNISMPVFSNILHVHIQEDLITLWAEVNPDPNIHKETRTFRAYMTGEPHGEGGHIYIGTVHAKHIGQNYVFHIYELYEQKS